MPEPIKEILEQPHVILCEGSGDASFLRHLIEVRKLSPCKIVYPRNEDPGGRQGFAGRLRSLRFATGYERVTGILVVSDNDANPTGSFKEVRQQILEAGFHAPNRPENAVPSVEGPSVAVLMLPAINVEGTLESLCLESMNRQWPELAKCTDQFSVCSGVTTWPKSKRDKACMRILIASACKNDPNTSLTHAWSGNRGDLIPLMHSCFDHIALYLSRFDKAPESP